MILGKFTLFHQIDTDSKSYSISKKIILIASLIYSILHCRYAIDEMIVIERWYPRRNSYVFLANLGNQTQTKDLSFLYYGGHVVVGPSYRLNQDVYFKELTVPPGEAFIIKLDK